MADQVYLCKTCGKTMNKASTPPPQGCSGGSHKWFQLGPAGGNQYTCKKCGATVSIGRNGSPNHPGCSAGGDHNWKKGA